MAIVAEAADPDLKSAALSLADKVDVVCLVTGDGVYVELVHHLRPAGAGARGAQGPRQEA